MRRCILPPELNMPLVNVCVFDGSCSRLLISWTVYCLEDERMTLESLFEMVVAKSEAFRSFLIVSMCLKMHF